MYTRYTTSNRLDFFDLFFYISLIFIFSVLFGMGLFVQRYHNENCVDPLSLVKPLNAQLVMNFPKTVPKTKKEPVPEIKKPSEVTVKYTVDLTEIPPQVQKTEEIITEVLPEKKPVRKVYGLRKVYSQGFGSGGNLSDAVVGKLGNTLNTEVDTFTASTEEIKGSIASVVSLTQAPKFKKTVKPLYSRQMLENHIEGIVKLKVLIDIDGKIKKATILSDIGFDSAQQAMLATRDMEFYPALIGDQAVAAWIIIPIRFVMIG